MKKEWEHILIPHAGANLHHIQVGKLEGVIKVSEDSDITYTLTIREDITADEHVHQMTYESVDQAKEAFKSFLMERLDE